MADETDLDRALSAGIGLAEKGEFDRARGCFLEAAARFPGEPQPHFLLGLLYRGLGRSDEAIEAYRRSLEHKPDHPEALNNLGVLLAARFELTEAFLRFHQALEARPSYAEAMNNLGNATFLAGDLEGSMRWYNQSLALRPDDYDTRFNRGQLKLLLGDMEAGWEEYEFRFATSDRSNPPRTYQASRWHGEELLGRTVFLYPEQGLGDAIQFVRYAIRLADRGATVIVESPPELRRLFERIKGIHRVIGAGESPPFMDFHCPLMSLPSVFLTGLDSIPSDVSYITPPPAEVARWTGRFYDQEGLRVGLVWAGNPRHQDDRRRSLPPQVMAPLAGVAGVRYYSLQKFCSDGGGKGRPPLDLIDWTDEFDDFASTAGLLAHLDLVISVDTAVVHLSGAMGRPTWALIPFAPDWRWLMERDDSPWYPTMRLFRQERLDDWRQTMQRLTRELETMVRRKRFCNPPRK